MKEISLIIYYLIAFLPGLISIFITFYLFAKYKDRLFKFYFCAQIIICLFILYLGLGIHKMESQPNSPLFLPAFYTVHLLIALFTGGLSFFIHSLLKNKITAFLKFPFLAIAALPLLIIILSLAAGRGEKRFFIAQSGLYFSHFLAYGTIIYIGILSILVIRNNRFNLLKQLVLPYSMLLVLFVPLWAADDYGLFTLFFETPISLSPLLFFLWNSSCIVFAAGHLLFTANEQGKNLKASTEFIEKFAISGREQEIMNLILTGLSNKEIAGKLFISPKTVNNHIYKIYQKMNIKTRFELIYLVQNEQTG